VSKLLFYHHRVQGDELKSMNQKKLKVIGIIAVLLLFSVAMVGAGAAASQEITTEKGLRDAVALGGEVRLGSDISLNNGELDINKTVTLDLAGHTLNAQSKSVVIYISSSGNLTLTDITGRGKITGGFSMTYSGGVMNNGGTFTMEAGTISGNSSNIYSGGVMNNGGTFTMKGGTISGNSSYYNGGGVYNNGGTFTMNGGTISGNDASIAGGGVYNNGAFTMNRGTISGNNASEGADVYNKGSFTQNGGTIGSSSSANGSSETNMSIKVVSNDGNYNMLGGKIQTNCGIGVYNNGTFIQEKGDIIYSSPSSTASGDSMLADESSMAVVSWKDWWMYGGSIGGGSSNASIWGGFYNGGNLMLGGSAKINNVILPKGKFITFLDGDDALKDDAKIGIWLEDLDRKDAPFKGNIKPKFINDGFIVCNNPGVHFKVDESGKPIIVKDDPEPVTPTTSHSSSVVSFRGEKSGNDFVFNNAVVIKKATLPGATSVRITNNGTGDGWYKFTLATDGFTGNGTLYFQVPLDVIEIKKWTVNDVSLFGSTTKYLGNEGQYAKYSATVAKDGTYTIGFEKDATTSASATTTTEDHGDVRSISISGAATTTEGTTTAFKVTSSDGITHAHTWSVSDPSIATIDANGNITALKAGTVKITVTDDDGCFATKTITVSPKASAQETPVTDKKDTTKQTTTKTPFPILGILAGLGIAGVLVMRRKL